MSLKTAAVRAIGGAMHVSGEFLARRLKNNFYLYLAGLFSVVVVLDVFVFHQVVDLRQKSYDFVIKNRLIKPKPDPQIVIVDINEASLAALSKEYGRWPWPRQVLGEFVEILEQQKPKAVVFDILFSDPDVYNEDSDAAFNEVIAGTDNVFFPMLRLPEQSDSLSQVKPNMIPGVTPLPGVSQEDKTVAVVLPHFEAALKSGRLGTHNIYPDSDGVARSYRMYHDAGGWKIPSLPLRVAEASGWKAPPRQDILLNWRGKPFTYRYVSFSDVYQDFLTKDRKRAPDEFKDKIVLIGSTAPSLFDVKPTSMAREFPGVEMLATAIDNLEHDDYIRVPGSRIPVLVAALIILWGTALGFYRSMEPQLFARVFGLSQIGLLVISYLTINLTDYFFNLTGPVTLGFVYFSIAKIYALATSRALERNIVLESLKGRGGAVGTIAVIQVSGRDDLSTGIVVRGLKKAVDKLGGHAKDVEVLRGKQRGIFGLLEGSLVVTWVHASDDEAERREVEREVNDLIAAVPGLVDRLRISGETVEARAVASAPLSLSGGQPTPAEWRRLLGAALAQTRDETA